MIDNLDKNIELPIEVTVSISIPKESLRRLLAEVLLIAYQANEDKADEIVNLREGPRLDDIIETLSGHDYKTRIGPWTK